MTNYYFELILLYYLIAQQVKNNINQIIILCVDQVSDTFKVSNAEWLQYFEEQKTKANSIQTDKETDAMVYALYELTEEEIKIVEG